jgi:hypothetical protein
MTWDEIDDSDPADFTIETMPRRFARVGDRHADIDGHLCSLDRLLELAAQQQREGQGDAPWPPQYKKAPGEPPRVQPSRRRQESGASRDAPVGGRRRVPKHPLVEVARARKKDDAMAGVERWKTRHPAAAAHLQPADVLVDAMRGRSSTWTRIRINLQHVPEHLRPRPEPLDPDDGPDDWSQDEIARWRAMRSPRTPARARKRS